MKRTFAVAYVVAAALVSVSCSGSSTTSDSGSSTASADSGSPAPSTPSAAVSSGTEISMETIENADEPLQIIFGGAWPSDPEEEEREHDRLIDECMSRKGFAELHSKSETSSTKLYFDIDEAISELGALGFAETYGFGYAEDSRARIEAEIANSADVPAEPPPGMEDILEDISEDELKQYSIALVGEAASRPLNDGGETNIEMDSGEIGGCWGEANEAQEPVPLVNSVDPYTEQIDAMYNQYWADPEIVKMAEDRQECMSSRGYDYSSIEELRSIFLAEAAETESGILGSLESTGELLADWSEQIEALRAIEIPVAVDEVECSPDFKARSEEILKEYELRFIEAHASEFGIQD